MDFENEFILEVLELLNDGESDLVNFCNGLDMENAWKGFSRVLHSIKGSAGFMENAKLEDHCHRMETFLDTVPPVDTIDDSAREELVIHLFKFTEFAKDITLGAETLSPFSYYECFEDLFKDDSVTYAIKHDALDIIVVDDDTITLSLLKKLLDKTSYNIKYYSNPLDVFEDVDRNCAPKIVISDIHMPEMDGIEFLKKFKTDIGDVPFVFITSLNHTKVFIDLVNEGGFAVLQKPIDKNKLMYNIRQAMKYSVSKIMADKCMKYILSNFSELSDFLDSVNKSSVKEEMKKEIELLYKLKEMTQ